MLARLFAVVASCCCVQQALARGPTPARCVSPATWEGRCITSQVGQSASFSEGFSLFSYDSSEERIAIKNELVEGDKREFYEEIFLFKQKLGYKINLKTRQCFNYTLLEPFRPIEVPTNATSRGEEYIGVSSVPGASVLVTLWSADTTIGRYSGSWTAVDCIPVMDSYVSATKGFIHRTFYDVVIGIPNPDVFVPPGECFQ
ncbi:mammalian ependymin-related protein 1-like isoform X2 [Sycon ciliatum]|uniref:mammalian ependymin-related protein 1-like isoform X1 n=1 Tax=Sycon ciliatum TaxID=27933 RepID=UPI0020A881B6|eukprot:scpid81637/ scgid8427/ Mammalian ependymin-related protein 1